MSTVIAMVRALHGWLLPERLPDDIRERSRSHLLVGTILVHVAITTATVAAFYTVVASPSDEATTFRFLVAGGTLGCYVAGLALFRLTGRRKLTVNILAGVVLVVLLSAATMMGGSTGPIPVLLLFVPATATLLADRRSGLVWSAVTLAALASLVLAEAQGVAFVSIAPPENLERAGHVILGLVFVLVVGALQIYDYQADRLAEELQIERNRYAYLAGHDPLTGLANRSSFDAHLTRAVARTHRLGVPFALLYVDLDEFKPVNDRYGHPAGDDVLRCVGERLRATTRENDMAARIGGDEFAVLLEGVDDPDVVDAIATKLADAIARPIPLDDRMLRVTASIGAVLHPETRGDARTLERLADEAMYRAKSGSGIFVAHSHPPSRF